MHQRASTFITREWEGAEPGACLTSSAHMVDILPCRALSDVQQKKGNKTVRLASTGVACFDIDIDLAH